MVERASRVEAYAPEQPRPLDGVRGDERRARDHLAAVEHLHLAELLDWGFDQYRVVEPVVSGREYARAETAYGRPAVRLVAAGSVVRLVRVGRPLVQRVVAPAVVSLPVRRGQVLGRVEIRADGRVLGSRQLVAANTIEKPNRFGRAKWYARRALDNAWDLVT